MADLESYLELLSAAGAAAGLLELRIRAERGMRQHFFDVADLAAAAAMIRGQARQRDVYVGVLARERPFGGRDAISAAHLVWAEVDDSSAAQLLARAPAPPTMVIASGSPGHLHAYWSLRRSVPVGAVEAANRRLAHAVGGDLACVDAARILRPPESLNHKHRPPARVELLELDVSRSYRLETLLADLPDPAPVAVTGERSRARPDRAAPADPLYARLRAIPSADYVAALAGLVPDRQGKVLCPFHVEHTPSLQLYPGGTWCCFGCRRGGSIVDFAGALWGLDTKGADFLTIRARLASVLFAITVTAPAGREVSGVASIHESGGRICHVP